MTQDALPVLLTVRGTLVPKDLEAARQLHNATAGSPEGIAAARSLGDISHVCFSAFDHPLSKAKPGELLFLDNWLTPEGLMQFFSNPDIVASAGRMFSARDATVWMPARGAYTWHLPAPRGQDRRYIGMLRGPVTSPEDSVAAFSRAIHRGVSDARRRGQLSHDVYIKLRPPGDDSPLEMLGVATWSSLEGLHEHYTDPNGRAAMQGVYSGPADPSVWEQAPGHWNEW
ncbi:MAG TPA: hypothetical protein VG755_02190 [Nannocystaceae bacterium]|nr:hypothetical protein [Nannocystaceae bacterium]